MPNVNDVLSDVDGSGEKPIIEHHKIQDHIYITVSILDSSEDVSKEALIKQVQKYLSKVGISKKETPCTIRINQGGKVKKAYEATAKKIRKMKFIFTTYMIKQRKE